MVTVRADLEALLNYHKIHSESEQQYIERLALAANDLSEADWSKLQDTTQDFVNEVLMVVGKNQNLSDKEKKPLPSFPDGPKKGVKSEVADSADEGETASEETSEEEAETEEAAPTKAAGKKAEPKTKKQKKAAPAKTEEPAVSRKSSKTRVSAKAASGARPSKDAGKGRGRPSKFSEDSKIKVLAKENPFREGSHNFKVFELYKDGMTVAAFAAAFNKSKGKWKGKVPMFLRYHASQGAIKIAG